MFPNLQDDFPGYPKNGSYLDSSTKGLQPKDSLEVSHDFENSTGYTVRKSLHKKARKSENLYFSSKETLAEFLGCKVENVAWIPNSDIASNMIIHAFINKFQGTKPTFISSIFEHHSILSPLLYLKEKGKIDLKLTGPVEEPCIPQYLQHNLTENCIAMFGHTTQVLGLYRDVKSISSICQENDIYSIIDFSRTAGQKKVKMNDLEIDVGFMDGSIDLLGPSGSGILYINQELIDEMENPFPSSGNVGRVTKYKVEQIENIDKFELGSPDIGAMIGLKKSVEYLNDIGIERIEKHRSEIIDYLQKQVSKLEVIQIIDPLFDKLQENSNRASSIAITGDFHPHDMALYLDETYNVHVRSGLVCSHPAINELEIEEILQLSTHVYTTKEDIDRFVEGLKEIILVMS